MIRFSVYGVPKPQGSVRAFKNIVVQGGSKESRTAQASWRTLVVDAVRRVVQHPIEDDAIGLRLTFYLPRPKSRAKAVHPIRKPDLDKLIRATGDALSTLLYKDDAQVCAFYVRKRYETAERTPGVDVEAWVI